MDWTEWIFTALLGVLNVIQFIFYMRLVDKYMKLKESENNG